MRVRIHRGAAQIGGTCVELESEGKRNLLDLGMPLDADDGEAALPDVPGLRAEDPNLLCVLISHLHGDHCGLVPYVSAGLPLAMGPIAARILREAEFFTERPRLPDPQWRLRDRESFDIGPFRITPYQVEHSAFDGFALLVEAEGRRLLYTGDFRAHGNDPEPFARLLRDPPRDVHALMMEGTQIGDERQGDGPSEGELRRVLARRFREHPGIVLATWSSQNLDRLRTMYEAAREAGRTLVIDLYTATLAKAARAPGIPVPGDDGVEVYCRKRERIQVKGAQAFDRTRSIRPWRIFQEELAPRAGELVIMLRPSMVHELERADALSGALAVWSMWRGYLDGTSERRMMDVFTRCGVALEVHHVSGHAYTRDLRRLVDAVQPERVIRSTPRILGATVRGFRVLSGSSTASGGASDAGGWMKTADDVVAGVRELLEGEAGQRQVARVVGYLDALNKAGEKLPTARAVIRERDGSAFFATVGNLIEKRPVLDVRIHGHLVGEVRLNGRGARMFHPAKRYGAGWPEDGREWRKQQVREFLESLEPGPKAKTTEALVQAELFRAMAVKSGKNKCVHLLRHQPVQMLGLPFQFPMPISASGACPEVAKDNALGHADVISRFGSGHRLRVFEIKKPGGKTRYAVRQAVAYAAAIQWLLEHHRQTMLRALEFDGSPKRLPIDAWAFVEASDVKDAVRGAKELDTANEHHRLAVMPYRMNGTELEVLDKIDV